MPRSALLLWSVALSLASGGAGCAAPGKLAYGPDELRAEVARRVPGVSRVEVVVPFELSPDRVERARHIVRSARSVEEKVRLLVEAMAEGGALEVRYSSAATATAERALQTSAGNCTALASLFIGLARSVGLQSYYADASVRVHETRHGDDGLTVNSGHITAIVENGNEVMSLDFARLGRIRWYRVIDDLEALAHYYNNRGFDLIEEARDRSLPVDWRAAAGEFRMATRVAPGFARAWNNLGIASAHLGDVEGAIRSYRASIARDSNLAAPYNNLGSLYLSIGDSAAALAVLEAAAALEPRGAHIQYNLARAKALQGDRGGAVEALRRAIELRGTYSEAQALLERLASPSSESAQEPRGGG